MLIRRTIYGIALLISLFAFVVANNQSALIILSILVLSAILSFVLLVIGMRIGVEISVTPHATNILRQAAVIHIETKGKKLLPLETIKLTLSYENCLYGDVKEQNFLLRPGSKKVCDYEWEWENIDSGNYKFAVKRITMYDIFGIWSLSLNTPSEFQMVSYPYVPQLEIGDDEKSKNGNEGEKYDLYSPGNDVTEVHDLRDYHEGDSIGSIHWKLSSKLDKLVVREFGKPSNDRTAIFCHGAFYGYEEKHKIVDGVIGMTAAISQGMINKGVVHHISTVQREEFVKETIYENKESIDAVGQILCMKLKESDNVLSTVKVNTITERVILVTGELDEELMSTLSEKSNLTVVLINDNETEYIDEREKFKVVSLPLGKLDKKIHQLEL